MTFKEDGAVSETERSVERMRLATMEVELTIRDRFTPAIEQAGDAMHLFWLAVIPWHKRWWHLLTGHRNRGYCLTHPFRETSAS